MRQNNSNRWFCSKLVHILQLTKIKYYFRRILNVPFYLLFFVCVTIIRGTLIIFFTGKQSSNHTCQRKFIRTVQQSIGSDSRPQHLIVDDFNGDHHLDFVVVNVGSSNIDVFLGFGNGTFLPKIQHSLSIESKVSSIAHGDFNHDQYIDLAVANYGTNSIGIHFGYGNGTFKDPIIYSLGSSRPVSIAIGNLNRDNHSDLIVANQGVANIMILQGSSHGLFQIVKIYDLGYDSMPASIHLVDFNLDQIFDIALVDSFQSELIVLLSNGTDRHIFHRYTIEPYAHPVSLTIGDFNADQQLDIVIANEGTYSIVIFFGLPGGSFDKIFQYVAREEKVKSRSIIAVDLTNDHRLDLIVVDSIDDEVWVLEGLGNGSFILLTKHSTGYQSGSLYVNMGDFDEDHVIDIIISNNNTNTILLLNTFSFYLNGHQTEYFSGQQSYPVAANLVDVNGDGELDIIVGTSSYPTVGVLFGRGNGTFDDVYTFFVDTTNEKNFALADMNNDGIIDLVIGQYDVSMILIYFGIGNGSFVFDRRIELEENVFAHRLALADFNKDGRIDIVFTHSKSDQIYIILQSSNSIPVQVVSYPSGSRLRPMQLLSVDLDSDGWMDIVVSMYIGKSIFIYLNQGNGTLHDPIKLLLGDQNPISIDIGDLNSDGRLDIVFVSSWTATMGIVLAGSDGIFSNFVLYSTGSQTFPNFVQTGHFNSDLYLDIAIANYDENTILIMIGYGDGTFDRLRVFSVGYDSAPSWLAIQDLNHDGQNDIIVTHSAENVIGVFLIHLEADFLNSSIYRSGSGPHPFSILAADFDKNSRFDVAVANPSNDDVQILLNHNNKTFSHVEKFTLDTGSHPQYVVAADFDNDQHLDIVVANSWTDHIQVWLGNGNGTFRLPATYMTGIGSSPYAIGVGNFNEDNWMDIAVVNPNTDTIQIFLGFDYSSFVERHISVTGIYSKPFDVAVADFNEDGSEDIALVNFGSSMIDFFFGKGDGTFQEQISISTGTLSKPSLIKASDINNDKHSDLLFLDGLSQSIGIFFGYGNGSFILVKSFYEGIGASLAFNFIDVNNDTYLDLVMMTFTNYTLIIYLGDKNGSFLTQITRSIPYQFFVVNIGASDLNNDQIIDIIIPSYHDNIFLVLFGQGNGSFQEPILHSTDQFYGLNAMANDDLNNDGYNDLIFYARKNQTIVVFYGSDQGNFSTYTTLSTGADSYINAFLIRDLNNDFILDIVYIDLGTGIGNLGVFYGRGNQSFAIRKNYILHAALQPLKFQIIDLNKDDRLDVVIIDDTHSMLSILLQNDHEPFSTPIILTLANGSHPKAIAIADIDHDHHLDMIITHSGINTIDLFHGVGDGSFNQLSILSNELDSFASAIAIDDFNHDHHLDIVLILSEINQLRLYFGNGLGQFSWSSTYPTGLGSMPSAIVVRDLNDDNMVDIIICNAGTNNILIMYGNNDGNFSQSIFHALGFNARPQSIAIGDVNGDGLVDIAVANSGNNLVEILLQVCSISDTIS